MLDIRYFLLTLDNLDDKNSKFQIPSAMQFEFYLFYDVATFFLYRIFPILIFRTIPVSLEHTTLGRITFNSVTITVIITYYYLLFVTIGCEILVECIDFISSYIDYADFKGKSLFFLNIYILTFIIKIGT